MQTIYQTHPNIEELGVRKRESYPDIIEDDFWLLYDRAKKYSMLHVTGFYNIYTSLKYIAGRRIHGDIVECGVLFGGASIFSALLCDKLGVSDKNFYLYDSFEGFPVGSSDAKVTTGPITGGQYKNFRSAVEANFQAEGISMTSVKFIEGFVEDTLVSHPLPEQISLLRLDTDFYDSTKVELEVLYPRLASGGVLIVDDYGLYKGSRQATDEYLNAQLLLNRIDVGVRAGIKT